MSAVGSPEKCWRLVGFNACDKAVASDLGLCADHLEEMKVEADLERTNTRPAPTSGHDWDERLHGRIEV